MTPTQAMRVAEVEAFGERLLALPPAECRAAAEELLREPRADLRRLGEEILVGTRQGPPRGVFARDAEPQWGSR